MVATHAITAQELWELGESEDAELIEGEKLPMVPPAGEHGEVQANLIFILKKFLVDAKLGTLYGEVGFRLQQNPDTVLAPDIAFVTTARVPADQSRFLPIAPDLAVEIVSPGNTPGEIERKVAIYLQAGVQLVWLVYPAQRKVVVHAPGKVVRVFAESDELPGDDLFPGMSLSVSNIFS